MRPLRALVVALVALPLLLLAALALGGGERARDRAATFVPSDALLYLQLSGDREGEQSERAQRLAASVPGLLRLRTELLQRVTATAGDFQWDRDIRPWLGEEAAVAVVGPEVASARSLLVLRAANEHAARAFAARVGGTKNRGRHRDTEILGGGTVAAALHKGFLLVGPPDLVRSALDVRSGARPALADAPTFRELRGQLPRERVAHGYASPTGLAALLRGPAAPLGAIPGASALRAGAFAASIEEKRLRLSFRAEAADPPPGARCGDRRGAKPPSPERVGPDALAYIGVRGADCLAGALVARPDSGVGAQLRRFAQTARGDSEVDLFRDLLPLLRGQTALTIAESRAGNPVLSVAAEPVDRTRALDALGRLQPALARAVDATRLGQAPTFRSRKLGDVGAFSARLAPALELTYAASGSRLVVSSSPEGAERALRGRGLDRTSDYRLLLSDMADSPADVVFLDLDRLLALGDRLGLTEEPGYRAVRAELAKFGAAGAVISRDDNHTTAELTLKTP